MEEALEAAEDKMRTDNEQITNMKLRISTLEREVDKSRSREQSQSHSEAETQAEIEALRASMRVDALMQAMRESITTQQMLATVAARSTIAAKEAAGELDYIAGRMRAGDEVDDLQATISALAEQLRDAARANDTVLREANGGHTANDSTALAPRIGGAIRRSRQSLSAAKTAPAPTVSITAPTAASLPSSTLPAKRRTMPP